MVRRGCRWGVAMVQGRITAVFAYSLLRLRGAVTQFDSCTNGTIADIGNGRCDTALNVPSCGFDGGDCCSCTCSDGPTHSCPDSDFDCVYPDCGNPTADTSKETTCNEDWLGDAYCDADNNHLGCSWDGGDCCECSCSNGPDYECGYNGYTCLDPACSFDPVVVAEYPECTGDWLLIGDGTCIAENNNAACGYDGGDCCLCTCTGPACVSTAFDCLDPGAGDELFDCEAPPPTALPCSPGVQQTWVVETPAQARALAAAVNCSGGSFEVEWRGRIVVDEPIYVPDGTVLTVSGADVGAVIDGNVAIRLFTVTNAVLRLNNLVVSSGNSTVGGAIAAVASSLALNQTHFIGNSATGFGGALFVSDGSNVSCTGDGTFSDNQAGIDGGAGYVTGSSMVSCGGSWMNNSAGSAGGALRVSDYSSVSWWHEATFSYNTAGENGGAVFASIGSTVSWAAPTSFHSNTAGVGGGAVYASDGSSISWNAPTAFHSNSASAGGGAMVVALGSSATWSDVTTYANNTVGGGGFGGALYLNGLAAASWSASTEFVGNTAGADGGAAFVYVESNLSWRGAITTGFIKNRAGQGGGAIAVNLNSHVSCTGDPKNTFLGNTAETGGAVSIFDGSRGSLTGTTEFTSNEAGQVGGAIETILNSDLSWRGIIDFTSNEAAREGGAIYLVDSTGSFGGNSSFDTNSAVGDPAVGYGGAMSVRNSTATWNGIMRFTGNRATEAGGALFVADARVWWSAASTLVYNNSAADGAGLAAFASNVSWSARTEFVQNAVISETGKGGGIFAHGGSLVLWTGNTSFVDNTARSGGGISIFNTSRASWSGETSFAGNDAWIGGGAYASGYSELYWSGGTQFINNTAVSGGAVFPFDGSSISWTGSTRFTSNQASADGGVVGSLASDSVNAMSVLVMNGSTAFANNTCGANGGALALLGGLTVEIGAVGITFMHNMAAVAGGAVFVSGSGVGPVFTGVDFFFNSAQVGGAVSTVGSGNLKDVADMVPPNPTTFDQCVFVGNAAEAMGGAIESAAGQDYFVSSVFEGNKAGTGGALRLAGTASLENCSFVENVSDSEAGTAVSNIGSLLKMKNISFVGNVFDCEPGMFLSNNATGDPYEAACDGCQATCDGCYFGEPPLLPICQDELDHSFSPGGTVTLEELSIEPGFWRATESGEDVLACYHADACLGGLTGTAGYCVEGYEGPYCSVCGRGYTSGLSFTCSKCSNSAGGIILAVVVIVVAVTVIVFVVLYVMSGEARIGGGIIECLPRYIPLQSLKIVIVAWQILTQFTSVANITYPDVYQHFLDRLDVFNFDLSWVLSAGCVIDVDFHGRLLMVTIGPIIAMLFLAVTYVIAARINHDSPDTLKIIWDKHVSMVLLLTFLVYSSVSSVLFMSYACEDLEDGKNYLRADYRIECDSPKHKGFQVYAAFMVVVYTVGIPTFYAVLLFRDRKVLRHDQADWEETARVSSISDLWKPYKPSRFYYEVIECGRRVLLASVVVFIYPNTAAQIAISLLMAFVFVVVSEALAPYASRWDTWLNRIGHAVVYVSMYVALLLKVDVSDERASSQQVFEALLVAAHACLVLVVVVETIVLGCALRVE